MDLFLPFLITEAKVLSVSMEISLDLFPNIATDAVKTKEGWNSMKFLV